MKKLVWTRLSSINSFAISVNGEFTVDSSSFAVGNNIEYLLAILNSKVILFYFKLGAVIWGKNGIKWFGRYFDNIPIPDVSTEDQSSIVERVNKILLITRSDDYFDDTVKQTHVKEFEKQIDQLVYKLYDLTLEEIAIVEEGK